MAVDFPSSPTVGQTFTSGGATWIWDGVKWTATGAATGLYLPLTGGTLTGDLILARDPVVPLGAATKQQIDAITAQGAFSHDNRIINGDMRIDQRNNGANGTANGYTIDRWWFFNTTAPTGRGTWGRAVAGPPLVALGFGYGLSFTSSSAYTPLAADNCGFFQMIEADMVSDFAWGTPGAQPVTLSFWVRVGLFEVQHLAVGAHRLQRPERVRAAGEQHVQRRDPQCACDPRLSIHFQHSEREHLDQDRRHRPRRHRWNVGDVGQRCWSTTDIRPWFRRELPWPS